MRFIKKMLAPKEVKAVIGILDELTHKYDNKAFCIIREHIEERVWSEPPYTLGRIFKKHDLTPRKWVYTAVANISGDILETGQYHLHRGVINPLGPGNDLLTIFNETVDELVKMGIIDLKKAEENKIALWENIKHVG